MGEEQAAGPAWGLIILLCVVCGFFVAVGIWAAEMLLNLLLGLRSEKGKQLMDTMAVKLGDAFGEKDDKEASKQAPTPTSPKSYKLN